MASMLSMVWWVCSSIVSPRSCPSGPMGPVPVTKMKSPARHPCEYAPTGGAPLSLRITCFGIRPPFGVPVRLPIPIRRRLAPSRAAAREGADGVDLERGGHERGHAGLPPGGHAVADSLGRPDQRDLVHQRVRDGRGRLALASVEVQVLDRRRLLLVAVPLHQLVVE